MSMLKRLWLWWHGDQGRSAAAPAPPHDDTPSSVAGTAAPPLPATQTLPPADETALAQLKATYRSERAQQLSQSYTQGYDGQPCRSLGDLRDFYVTSGRDLAELDRLVAEVDFDLTRDYMGS